MSKVSFKQRGKRYAAEDIGTIGSELHKLGGKKGRLVAGQVVYAASDPDSPLHRFFDWDDTVAAEKWRLEQARKMIQEVEVVIEEVQTRAWQSVVVEKGTANEGRVYVRTDVAFREPKLASQIIDKAMAEVRAWRERYSDYSQLASIFEAIDGHN